MGNRPFDFALLKQEISRDPPSPIRSGEDEDGVFQGVLKGISFTYPLINPGKVEPVLLFQGVSLNGHVEILGRFLQVNLEEVVLMEDPQFLEGVWVGRFDPRCFKEVFSRIGFLGEDHASPYRDDVIACKS